MELIIDFDNIKDPGKKEWLLHTLKLMGIGYHSVDFVNGLCIRREKKAKRGQHYKGYSFFHESLVS